VAWYRFYRLDTLGKITDIPVGGDYVDDDSAVAAATKGMDGNVVEVWQGARRVTTLTHPKD
jgi:hypothetical protein